MRLGTHTIIICIDVILDYNFINFACIKSCFAFTTFYLRFPFFYHSRIIALSMDGMPTRVNLEFFTDNIFFVTNPTILVKKFYNFLNIREVLVNFLSLFYQELMHFLIIFSNFFRSLVTFHKLFQFLNHFT